ncbi:MAG: OsmC family protein, partial [Candidatus Omnitrophota bacterium]
FTIDTKGSGVTPPDTLLASIGSCLGVYIRKYAEGAKLDIREFGIRVEADFTSEKPARFKDITVIIDLKGFELDERRKRSFLEFIKNCPVHNTLKSDPSVRIDIV